MNDLQLKRRLIPQCMHYEIDQADLNKQSKSCEEDLQLGVGKYIETKSDI